MYKLKDRAGVARRAKKHGLHNTKRRKHRLALKVAENNQKLQERRIRKMIAHAMRTQGMQMAQMAPQPEAIVNTEIVEETVVDEDTVVVDEDTQEPEKYPENGM